MSIIARIFIAAVVCPALGSIVGQDLARAAGNAAHIAAGALARWEMMGLLGGAFAGLIYAVLAVYCVVACGERVRARIADPIVLTLGGLGVAELLVHRGMVAPALASTVRAVTIFTWLLGLVFVVLAVEYRPRPAAPPEPEVELDEHVTAAPERDGSVEALERNRTREPPEERENG